MATQQTIDQMVSRIISKSDPLRVILFGSFARNESGLHSDVDLLVVMPEGTDTRKAAIAMMSEVRLADASKDIIVATPETLRRFGNSPWMVYASALRDGRVLYERN